MLEFKCSFCPCSDDLVKFAMRSMLGSVDETEFVNFDGFETKNVRMKKVKSALLPLMFKIS